MIANFVGNSDVVSTLEGMLRRDRIPQTILLAGPEGIGKATLVRRFAGATLGDAAKVERDDLSLPDNAALITEREKWPSEKRTEDPLLFASHPDFVTFAPDGPLRQISIQQMRILKERAQYKPLRGERRIFLVDRVDRANEQAANSLLKVLEEPPEHLLIFLTAVNPQDLLPTIRSRSIVLTLGKVTADELREFLRARSVRDADRRVALSSGSPGLALSMDLELWDKRRAGMLKLLQTVAGSSSFGEWSKLAESIGSSRSDKLDGYLDVLYSLLEDVLLIQNGCSTEIRNTDIQRELAALAAALDFATIRQLVARVDELVEMVRRNIQKGIALDALAVAATDR